MRINDGLFQDGIAIVVGTIAAATIECVTDLLEEGTGIHSIYRVIVPGWWKGLKSGLLVMDYY